MARRVGIRLSFPWLVPRQRPAPPGPQVMLRPRPGAPQPPPAVHGLLLAPLPLSGVRGVRRARPQAPRASPQARKTAPPGPPVIYHGDPMPVPGEADVVATYIYPNGRVEYLVRGGNGRLFFTNRKPMRPNPEASVAHQLLMYYKPSWKWVNGRWVEVLRVPREAYPHILDGADPAGVRKWLRQWNVDLELV